MRAILTASVAVAALCAASAAAHAAAPAWAGYAGNAQHSAQAPAAAQAMVKIHWQTPVDLAPQFSGTELLIHYGSPMMTAANTVLIPVKTTATGGFHLEARRGSDGVLLWAQPSNFVTPSASWRPSFPAALTANRVYFAAAGGNVKFRDAPDLKAGVAGKIAFYGNAAYAAAASVFNKNVMINTPITADAAGNIYFGFLVTGTTPAHLSSGIARIAADGTGSWVSAANAAADSSMIAVAMNAAPAVSNDGRTIYVAVTSGAGGALVALDASTLALQHKVALIDPNSGSPAWLINESSASPTVGPDGDVYFGVLESPMTHHDRGWLLHYDATLATTKIPGSFGWDDTVSVVPASSVPSYTGTSSYLLFTKYNNYIELGGAGDNKIAVIDPNATMVDTINSNVLVMKDVKTLLGQTAFPGVAGAVYEWCINSGVVDAATKSVIANSEDGRLYRYDLTTGTATQSLTLNAPRPEAYTPTLVGPDGTIYAINNGTLYAVGK